MIKMVKKFMIFISFGLATFAALSSISVRAALIPGPAASGEAQIRVRLAEAIPVVAIRGYDLQIYQADKGVDRALAYSPAESSEWEFRCEDDRVRAISSRSGKTLDLHGPVTISTPAGLLSFQNRPYREELKIYPIGSFCEVVNELGLEKYLAGLVNAEFNSRWNEPSIEAQVIAARTYALYQIRATGRTRHYDVDSTVKDQVYDGYAIEDYRGSAAVRKTRGWVLLASMGSGKWEPLKAFYHSTCAGRTELPQQVWGNSFPGFKHIVNCPFCAHSPNIAWDADLSAAEVSKMLERGANADGAPADWPSGWRALVHGARLVDLRPGPWTISYRRSWVSTFWSVRTREGAGRAVELRVPAVRFRDWMGAARFKSTAFDVFPRQNALGTLAWHFHGRGNGHGVGMCQWGAKVMGDRGYSTAAILKFYYPDALLRKLW